MPTMRCARLFGPNDLRLIDMPVPELKPHEVLCRVVRCGICGTDHAIYTGEFSGVRSGIVHFPMTLGHEWAGTVAALGPGVTHFEIGDRVVGDTGVACGNCNECLLGNYGNCTQCQAVGTVNAWDGAYAEYIVMPERHLFALPESVSFEMGAMVEPAATALYAVVRAEVRTGDTVLVNGTGPIGLCAAKLAQLSGASRVLVAGRRESKLKLALEFGADAVIDTTKTTLRDAVHAEVGKAGVDKIIEASGSVPLFAESIGCVHGSGIISVVAFYEKPLKEFDIDQFVFTNATMHAVGGSLGQYPPVIRLMAAGKFDPTVLITARYPFEDVLQGLKDWGEKPGDRVKSMLVMQ
jgi:2-desacetyl-2-hydroxyethyl bacteriochlorophyllide A dehydrogenase